jgi:hypothetical protein
MLARKLMAYLAFPALLLFPEAPAASEIKVQTGSTKITVDSGRSVVVDSGDFYYSKPDPWRSPSIYQRRSWYTPRTQGFCSTRQITQTSRSSGGSVYSHSSTSTSICR